MARIGKNRRIGRRVGVSIFTTLKLFCTAASPEFNAIFTMASPCGSTAKVLRNNESSFA